jgi:hypothetical protein
VSARSWPGDGGRVLGERAGGFLQRQAVLADHDEMVKQLGSMLVEDAGASCGYDLAGISPGEAVQIAAGFAAGNWPPDVGPLPWVTSAYPG